MRVHFIAVGGAAMHNLAIALHERGDRVTGSDDEIFEPSKSRLAGKGLLPPAMGWDPARISPDIDVVILGMHARAENPELVRACELGLQVSSFPEFLYEQTCDKCRVVVGGSHGKTTVTALVMHVLRTLNRRFDYLVGSQIEGFETMVGLSNDSQVAVFEGDEYLASALVRLPKFHLYRPHIGLINGIAWDHINVFPTEEGYIHQFKIFSQMIEKGGSLIYYRQDPLVCQIVEELRSDISAIGFGVHPYRVENGSFLLETTSGPIPVGLFGRHNMQNIAAAREICETLEISEGDFYAAVRGFRGAARRLQLIGKGESTSVYLDFAHAPSKVRATTDAVRELWPERSLCACLELHTFSSLDNRFLPQYAKSLDSADRAFVYFDPATIERKKLPPVSKRQVELAFEHPHLVVVTGINELVAELERLDLSDSSLLLMTSGSFGGLDFQNLSRSLIRSG